VRPVTVAPQYSRWRRWHTNGALATTVQRQPSVEALTRNSISTTLQTPSSLSLSLSLSLLRKCNCNNNSNNRLVIFTAISTWIGQPDDNILFFFLQIIKRWSLPPASLSLYPQYPYYVRYCSTLTATLLQYIFFSCWCLFFFLFRQLLGDWVLPYTSRRIGGKPQLTRKGDSQSEHRSHPFTRRKRWEGKKSVCVFVFVCVLAGMICTPGVSLFGCIKLNLHSELYTHWI